jgi:hypothetical protein
MLRSTADFERQFVYLQVAAATRVSPSNTCEWPAAPVARARHSSTSPATSCSTAPCSTCRAIDPGAFDDKPMRPYNVGPDGLLINFRALRFTLLPDNGKPRVLMETPSEGLRVDNQLRAGERRAAVSNWKDLISRPSDPGKQRQPPRIHRHLQPRLCGEKPLNLSPLARRRPGQRPDPRACGRSWAAASERAGARRQCRAIGSKPARPATNRRRWPMPCATSTSSATT